mmetsp:Transcript_128200/g.273366  ORF Transcript_128200/g.273366 Transcript_128200/m.273366 type:complete len:113 (-) Transcript_128200:482-820(-)
MPRQQKELLWQRVLPRIRRLIVEDFPLSERHLCVEPVRDCADPADLGTGPVASSMPRHWGVVLWQPVLPGFRRLGLQDFPVPYCEPRMEQLPCDTSSNTSSDSSTDDSTASM